MQNIDPLYILEPVVVIALSAGLIIYWRFSGRKFTRYDLLFALVAYAGAILLKVIVQLLTVNAVESAFGSVSVATGLYYGLQTVFFEVGGAYVVARYAVSRQRFSEKDAAPYGISLAFWENGIYLGLFSLISVVSIYAVLATGPAGTAQQVYNALQTGQASLFYPPSKALPLVGFGIMERISSIIDHCSWGFLCVVAAIYRRSKYLAIALPMGMTDFLVPYASVLGLASFELIIFLFALICLFAALYVARSLPKPAEESAIPPAGAPSSP